MSNVTVVDAAPQAYSDWLEAIILDSERRRTSHVVIEIEEARSIAEILKNGAKYFSFGGMSKSVPEPTQKETIYHCVACGVEIDREDLENGHVCEKCRTGEWQDRRKFSQMITKRRNEGHPLSEADFRLIENKIVAKYSAFAHLDKEE